MRIVLFELFGIQIKSYGLMIAIGIIVAASIGTIYSNGDKGHNKRS